MASVYFMKGEHSEIEVFEDKLTLTPKGVMGLLSKGLQGTKTMPFSSITAIQLKEAGIAPGYIQFSMLGGNECKGGMFGAIYDENSFMFNGKSHNELARNIKDYIESKINNAQPNPASNAESSADELSKYFDLKEKGVITEEEFQAKKKQLLGL